tara:strand:- start:50 stop:928 length:879 start_codon:yes stop_codon:yes gene_type:complete
MPIRKVSTSPTNDTLVKRIGGVGSSGTKVRKVTVGRPVSAVTQHIGANIKSFDGLGDIPSIEELKLGEFGINTQDGKVYIKREYDGGIQTIVEIGTGTDNLSATTTFNSYIYTSDGTLQTITGVDDSGNVLDYDPNPNYASKVQVYLNGVLLHQGIDYVADTGDSIVLTHLVDAEMVVQIAAYNSTGVSLGNDLIVDDHFAFTVGTDEETRFYHNSVDTILKHMGFNDAKFKIQYLNDDRFILDQTGVQLLGSYTLNGENITTQTTIDQLESRLDSLDSDIAEIKTLLSQLP